MLRRLAHQMSAKLPANVELDDLIQVGMIGLSDALSRFDAAQGVQFETFATQRIRGAMLDELRGNDWMSRGDRRHQPIDLNQRWSASRRLPGNEPGGGPRAWAESSPDRLHWTDELADRRCRLAGRSGWWPFPWLQLHRDPPW
jgi:RNA polymerase sigma factor (sigma-70 family)